MLPEGVAAHGLPVYVFAFVEVPVGASFHGEVFPLRRHADVEDDVEVWLWGVERGGGMV